jgi:HpaII restriction endonuclease
MTGNRGEWSEIYTFLKLLADGKLNAADANLQAIPNVYYPIIKILRRETNSKREYLFSEQINVGDLAQSIYFFIADINGTEQTIKFIKL